MDCVFQIVLETNNPFIRDSRVHESEGKTVPTLCKKPIIFKNTYKKLLYRLGEMAHSKLIGAARTRKTSEAL